MAFRGCIDLGAHKKLRLSLEIIANHVIALLETLGRPEQAHHIEIEDWLGFKVISNGWMISLKNQDVFQTQGRGVEEFGLEYQTVSIATGKIEDHLHPSRLQ